MHSSQKNVGPVTQTFQYTLATLHFPFTLVPNFPLTIKTLCALQSQKCRTYDNFFLPTRLHLFSSSSEQRHKLSGPTRRPEAGAACDHNLIIPGHVSAVIQASRAIVTLVAGNIEAVCESDKQSSDLCACY